LLLKVGLMEPLIDHQNRNVLTSKLCISAMVNLFLSI